MINHWCAHDDALLLLLEHKDKMVHTSGVGDYNLADDKSTPLRAPDRTGHFMFTGIRIVEPSLITNAPQERAIYSFLTHMDDAQEKGILGAQIHQGQWHHISTPNDVKAINELLANTSSDDGQKLAGAGS